MKNGATKKQTNLTKIGFVQGHAVLQTTSLAADKQTGLK